MRITIAQLQEKLERSESDRKRYYDLWQEAKRELDKHNEFRSIVEETRADKSEAEIYRLMDIIRILAKDERLVIEANNRNPNVRSNY